MEKSHLYPYLASQMGMLQMDPQTAVPQQHQQTTLRHPAPQPGPPNSTNSYVNGLLTCNGAETSHVDSVASSSAAAFPSMGGGGAFFPTQPSQPPPPQCFLPPGDQQGLYNVNADLGNVSGMAAPTTNLFSNSLPVTFDNQRELSTPMAPQRQQQDEASAAAAAAMANQQMALFAQSIQLFAAAINSGGGAVGGVGGAIPRLTVPRNQNPAATAGGIGVSAHNGEFDNEANGNGFLSQGQYNLLEKMKASSQSS